MVAKPSVLLRFALNVYYQLGWPKPLLITFQSHRTEDPSRGAVHTVGGESQNIGQLEAEDAAPFPIEESMESLPIV